MNSHILQGTLEPITLLVIHDQNLHFTPSYEGANDLTFEKLIIIIWVMLLCPNLVSK